MSVQADLSRLLNADDLHDLERYEGFQAGGGGVVKKDHLKLTRARLDSVQDAVALVTLLEGDGQVEMSLPVLGFPGSWRGYHTLSIEIEVLDEALTIEWMVVGARSRLIQRAVLIPSEKQTVTLDLNDLPLTAGKRAAFEPSAVRLCGLWGGDVALSDYDRVRRDGEQSPEVLGYAPGRPGGTRVLKITGIELGQIDGRTDVTPIVDQFGQRRNKDWPGKVKTVAEMQGRRDAETESLKEIIPPRDRSRFGGFTQGKRFEATGYFHVINDEGIWWFIDPEGYPFYSQGVTGVRSWDNTLLDGREELFETLPVKDDPLYPEVVNDGDDSYTRGLKFYGWNILRKYGSREAWRDRVCDRFEKWGLNTIANWSEEVMFDQERVAFTLTASSRCKKYPAIIGRFADVFHPEFESDFNARMDEELSQYKDNPWVLGVFVDNEANWGQIRVLDTPTDLYVRDEWLSLLKEKAGNDLTVASRILGMELNNWTDARNVVIHNNDADGVLLELLNIMQERYAERYFEIISKAINRVLPNHMYMGCRMVRGVSRHPWSLPIAGKYCEVLSINTYDLYPRPAEMGLLHEKSGRPICIGEHHYPLASDRQLPPLYPAFRKEERRLLYPKFAALWAKQPFAIGDHWYQHADQAATGRGLDGENQLVGLVDITDTPHEEMIEAVMEVAQNIYEWKTNPDQ